MEDSLKSLIIKYSDSPLPVAEIVGLIPVDELMSVLLRENIEEELYNSTVELLSRYARHSKCLESIIVGNRFSTILEKCRDSKDQKVYLLLLEALNNFDEFHQLEHTILITLVKICIEFIELDLTVANLANKIILKILKDEKFAFLLNEEDIAKLIKKCDCNNSIIRIRYIELVANLGTFSAIKILRDDYFDVIIKYLDSKDILTAFALIPIIYKLLSSEKVPLEHNRDRLCEKLDSLLGIDLIDVSMSLQIVQMYCYLHKDVEFDRFERWLHRDSSSFKFIKFILSEQQQERELSYKNDNIELYQTLSLEFWYICSLYEDRIKYIEDVFPELMKLILGYMNTNNSLKLRKCTLAYWIETITLNPNLSRFGSHMIFFMSLVTENLRSSPLPEIQQLGYKFISASIYDERWIPALLDNEQLMRMLFNKTLAPPLYVVQAKRKMINDLLRVHEKRIAESKGKILIEQLRSILSDEYKPDTENPMTEAS